MENNDPEVFEEPINESGLWYRTQYLVLNRTLMEAMPKDWQKRMVALLEEISEEFDYFHPDWVTPKYEVKAKDSAGQFISDPWGPYRYPNRDYVEKLRRNKEQPHAKG